ncbi:MAG: putative MFS-type transporter YcaD [Chlamydiae bacterium]|nr:putative MFS-type transporter YcaD [Chlamydiota bacterium]
MKKTLKNISAPLLSLALLMLSNGFFLTFVSARLHAQDYSPISIGVIQGSYYAGFLIAALKSEHIIQRIKHIRAFSFFASIATVCTLATVFASHIVIWIFMRFVMGICIASLYVVIESWFLIVSDKKNRGVVLGIYMFGLYFSQSASQYIMNFVDIESLMAFIVAGMLGAFSIFPVTFTHSRIPDMEVPPPSAILKFFVIAPLGTAGAVLSGVMLGSFYTFGPNFAQSYNFSIAHIMSLTIAGGFLLQYPIGHLSDFIDRRKMVIAVSAMALLMAAGLIIFLNSQFWVFFFSFMLGGFSFTIYPLCITQVVDRVHANHATTVAGAMLFAYSIGAVIGPLVTPIFIAIFNGEKGLYYSMAFSSLLLFVLGLVIISIKRPVPINERESFVAIPPQTPVVGDLDPRNEIPKQDPSRKE